MLEGCKLPGLVEVVFQFRDMALFAVVAAQFVEHLHKDFEDRGSGVTADVICLLVDIEENAVGWDLHGARHVAT